MPNGKYFLIKHTYSSLVLEMENGRDRSGAPVTLAKLTSKDEQLWYYDHTTYTIRNKLNDHCLDSKGDNITLTPYQRIRDSQHWQMTDSLLVSRSDQDFVIGIPTSEETKAGMQAVLVDKEGLDHKQKWQFIFCEAKYFQIRNQHSDKVLDVHGSSPKAGTSVILFQNKGDRSHNQLWYEDQNGFVRSKLNDYLLTKESGSNDIVLHPPKKNLMHDVDAKKLQGWLISGTALQNCTDSNDVLEYRIPGGAINFISSMIVNPVLCRAKYDGKQAQHWFIDYVHAHSLTMRNSHSGLGKYCIITHRISKMLLTSLGDSVVLSLGKIDKDGHYNNSQLWIVNDTSCTIQSVADKKCISLNEIGDCLTLIDLPKNPDATMSGYNWKFSGCKIHQQMSTASVLSVMDDEPEDGTIVTIATDDSSDGQQWIKQHVAARCFYIYSYLNDRVLHVQSGEEGDEGRLIMWDKYEEPAEEQLWYEDEQGLLRSMLNGYVPDAAEGRFRLREYNPELDSQKWIRHADTIRNLTNPQMVLDIKRRCPDIGTPVISFKFADQQNQKWYFTTEDLKPQAKDTFSYFYLRSHLNNRVLTVQAGSPQEGSNVVMWDKIYPPANHQLWYFNPEGYLFSKLNKFIPVPDLEVKGRVIRMRRYDADNPKHAFTLGDASTLSYQGAAGLVMDITKKNKSQGASVSVFRHISGNSNQKWHLDYV